MNILDDYEEGAIYTPARKYWWQLWLPKSVRCGSYTAIGNVVHCRLSTTSPHTDQDITAMFPDKRIHIVRYMK